MSDFTTIRFEVDDGVGRLVLNRPDVINAINSAIRCEITQVLGNVSDRVRCVVITGEGRELAPISTGHLGLTKEA